LNLRLLSYAILGERIVVNGNEFGALGSALSDSVLSDSKSPRRIFRRGLCSCDDEDMPVICPTCQNVFAGSLKRPDHATLHGVVFDIFVERP
jgi:hypothetical protein